MWRLGAIIRSPSTLEHWEWVICANWTGLRSDPLPLTAGRGFVQQDRASDFWNCSIWSTWLPFLVGIRTLAFGVSNWFICRFQVEAVTQNWGRLCLTSHCQADGEGRAVGMTSSSMCASFLAIWPPIWISGTPITSFSPERCRMVPLRNSSGL